MALPTYARVVEGVQRQYLSLAPHLHHHLSVRQPRPRRARLPTALSLLHLQEVLLSCIRNTTPLVKGLKFSITQALISNTNALAIELDFFAEISRLLSGPSSEYPLLRDLMHGTPPDFNKMTVTMASPPTSWYSVLSHHCPSTGQLIKSFPTKGNDSTHGTQAPDGIYYLCNEWWNGLGDNKRTALKLEAGRLANHLVDPRVAVFVPEHLNKKSRSPNAKPPLGSARGSANNSSRTAHEAFGMSSKQLTVLHTLILILSDNCAQLPLSMLHSPLCEPLGQHTSLQPPLSEASVANFLSDLNKLGNGSGADLLPPETVPALYPLMMLLLLPVEEKKEKKQKKVRREKIVRQDRKSKCLARHFAKVKKRSDRTRRLRLATMICRQQNL